MELVVRMIGIFAMIFNVWSYQQKSQKNIIALQLFGSTLFTVQFFMLNAYMGALLSAIGIIRAIVFLFRDKFKADHVIWLLAFILVYILSYILTFSVFGKAFTALNALVEILPVIGMTATTFAFRSKTAKTTRLLGLISAPSWLIYNIVSLSIGAICCAVFSLVSIVVGFFRLDRKQKGGYNA